MIYLSKSIKFKKETECILQKTRDKQIEQQTAILKALTKQNEFVESELIRKRSNHEQAQERYFEEYERLLLEKQKILKKIFMKSVRKNQIISFKNPQKKVEVTEIVRKYIFGFKECYRYQLIKNIGGISNYKRAKQVIFNIKTIIQIKPQIRAILYKKVYPYWHHQFPTQKLMMTVKSNKQLPSHLLMNIFTINGPYNHIARFLTLRDFKEIFKHTPQQIRQNPEIVSLINPLNELLIIWKQGKIYLLKQYLELENKRKTIQICVKKFRLKIYLQKERKKMVFFQKLKIRNLFETYYGQEGFKNVQLEVLVIVKDRKKTLDDMVNNLRKLRKVLAEEEQIIKQKEELSIKIPQKQNLQKQIAVLESSYIKLSDNGVQPDKDNLNARTYDQKFKYIFYCYTIKSYPTPLMFSIQDKKILENINLNQNQNFGVYLPVQDLSQYFTTKFLIQLKPPIIQSAKKGYKKKTEYSLYDRELHFQSTFRNTQLYDSTPDSQQLPPPRIVKSINFSQIAILNKIIRLQSFLKMKIYSKKYQESRKINLCLKFNYSYFTNILLSIIVRNQKVIFFVECLFLSSEGNRKHKKCLEYPQKYWKLAKQLLAENGKSIIEHCLVWEIEQEIKRLFDKRIVEYQFEQERLLAQKPQKIMLRLQKFFTMIVLRKNRSKNIIYIKKLKKNFGTLVFMIRKSSSIKSIYEALLFGLPQRKFGHNIYTTKKMFQKIYLKQEQIKDFKSAQNIFTDIQNQFYISENNFICKPFQNRGYKFLERFNYVRIYQTEIQNELYSTYKRLKDDENLKNDIRVNYEERLEVPETESILGLSGPLVNFLNISEKPLYQSTRQQQYKSALTIIKETELQIPSQITVNKSRKNVNFEICTQNEIVFYSLYKNMNTRSFREVFYLSIFLLKSNQGYEMFEEVFRKQFRKKDIYDSTWNLVHRTICQWLLLGKKAMKLGMTIKNIANEKQNEDFHDSKFLLKKKNKQQQGHKMLNTTIDMQLKRNKQSKFSKQNI